MARPRKTQAASYAAITQGSEVERGNTAIVATHDIEAIVADFRARFPDEWNELRLCPLEYGLIEIAERLKA